MAVAARLENAQTKTGNAAIATINAFLGVKFIDSGR
jgi:hypothetical protein